MPQTTLTPVSETELENELRDSTGTPHDAGGDCLPFDHLSGRRFEVLAYFLKKEACSPGQYATLVKSSGDRGRDVLLYQDSRLSHIVQCKNQLAALSKPELMRELLKNALHTVLDSNLLPSADSTAVTFEVWCTGGFTEPAANLIDTWPTKWIEADVYREFLTTLEQYKAFSELIWSEVKDYLLNIFPRSITPRKIEGIDISAEIRARPRIYSQFFSGMIVAALPDVRKAVTDALRDADWRPMSNDDLKRIVDRLEAFPEKKRLHLGMGFVFGVSPKFLAELPREDQQKFIANCFESFLQNTLIVQSAVTKKIEVLGEEYLPRLKFSNTAFRLVLQQVLLFRALGRVTKMSTPDFLLSMLRPEFLEQDLWLLVDSLARRAWGDFQAVLSPDFVPPTNDSSLETLRKAGARHVVSGYESGEQFIDQLLQDFRNNLPVIREVDASIADHFPQDIIVVADTRSAFHDPSLMLRFADSLAALKDAAPRDGQ